MQNQIVQNDFHHGRAAKTDAERAAARLAVNEAARAITAASDRLKTKEILLLEHIMAYRDARITEVKNVSPPKEEKDKFEQNKKAYENVFNELVAKAQVDPPALSADKKLSCEAGKP